MADRTRVEDAHKGYVGAIRKAGVVFDMGAERAPVEIEIIDEYGTLRVADIENYAVVIEHLGLQLFDYGSAHIHLEGKRAALALEQAKLLGAGAGLNHDIAAGGVRGLAGVDQKRGGAAGAVARHFTGAPVRIEQLNGGGNARGGTGNQQPAIRPGTGATVGNGASGAGEVESCGNGFAPGEQEIVVGAVCLGERNLHQNDVKARNSSKRASISARVSVRKRSTPKRSQQKLPSTDP